VSGGSDGCVRFYDGGLRLVAWFDDIHAGPVTSVAFAAPRVRVRARLWVRVRVRVRRHPRGARHVRGVRGAEGACES
jgi:hypothetical protein